MIDMSSFTKFELTVSPLYTALKHMTVISSRYSHNSSTLSFYHTKHIMFHVKISLTGFVEKHFHLKYRSFFAVSCSCFCSTVTVNRRPGPRAASTSVFK